MAYVVGVDIGSNSIAASVASDLAPGAAAPRSFLLDARRRTDSALFVEDDGRVAVGAEAVARGCSRPDRLVRGFVDRVGDDIPMVVGAVLVAPEDAIAAAVRWVVDRVEEAEGSPASGVVLVHPVSWGPYRTGLVHRALARAGVVNPTLVPDAEAVAVTYSARQDVPAGTPIAVYDFAGESVRVQLFRTTGGGSVERLSRSESVRAGGRDLDALLLDHVLGNLARTPAEVPTLDALLRDSRAAKEALSTDTEALVTVSTEDTVTRVRVVRSEFEELIAPVIVGTIAALRRLLGDAGLAPEDLGAVLLTGGSSRVPLVTQLLSEELGRLLVPDLEPAGSAAGTALAALSPLAPDLVADALGTSGALSEDGRQEASPVSRGRRFRRSRQFAPPVLVAVAASLAACTILVGPGSGTRLAVSDSASAIGAESRATAAGPTAAASAGSTTAAEQAERAEPTPSAPPAEEGPSGSDVFESVGFETAPKKSTPLVTSEKLPATGSPAPTASGGSGSAAAPAPAPSPAPVVGPTAPPSTDPTPDPTPEPDPSQDPTPAPDPSPDPTPEPTPDPEPAPDPEPTSTPDPDPTSEPSPEPSVAPSATSAPEPAPTPSGSAPISEG